MELPKPPIVTGWFFWLRNLSSPGSADGFRLPWDSDSSTFGYCTCRRCWDGFVMIMGSLRNGNFCLFCYSYSSCIIFLLQWPVFFPLRDYSFDVQYGGIMIPMKSNEDFMELHSSSKKLQKWRMMSGKCFFWKGSSFTKQAFWIILMYRIMLVNLW